MLLTLQFKRGTPFEFEVKIWKRFLLYIQIPFLRFGLYLTITPNNHGWHIDTETDAPWRNIIINAGWLRLNVDLPKLFKPKSKSTL